MVEAPATDNSTVRSPLTEAPVMKDTVLSCQVFGVVGIPLVLASTIPVLSVPLMSERYSRRTQ